MRMRLTAEQKLEKYSTPDPNSGCTIWSVSMNSENYGRVSHAGFSWFAHRLSYQTFVGPIPAGMVICHKCDTPSCINPAHLYAGTQKENVNDCKNKGRSTQFIKRTHCKKGHEFNKENTRIIKTIRAGSTYEWQECIECHREKDRNPPPERKKYLREWRIKNRESLNARRRK